MKRLAGVVARMTKTAFYRKPYTALRYLLDKYLPANATWILPEKRAAGIACIAIPAAVLFFPIFQLQEKICTSPLPSFDQTIIQIQT